ncbi:MAG: tungstate ABC transporter substrate-binding protein WtpA [Crenarchaeota archaeon]|nr:tungstate ABC transporter substrate-binding protein WtpA [Thermoproteota archaeon]
MPTRAAWIAVIVCIAVAVGIGAGLAYWHHYAASSRQRVVVVCAADSLAKVLQSMASKFESEYGAKVLIETGGSVKVVRMITELHKRCDVVMLADYRLIPLYLEPNYTKWYAIFTSNEVVLAFTPQSKLASYLEKHPSKWYDVLEAPGVRFAFSNPNKDPCGYRTVGVIALASLYYHNASILRDLLLSNLEGVRAVVRNNTISIYVYPSIAPRGSKIVIRPKSIDFIALLESHDIDYAFVYRSTAVSQHLKFIELPPQVNLGSPSLDNYYSRVVVHILCGTSFEKAIPMKSIAYGLTVLSNAPHPQEAMLFAKFVLGEEGRSMLSSAGFEPLNPPKCFGSVPSELAGVCSVETG